tara:strand:- start:173 stop:496 length:324 start_codon:yes stop_codon:yes gene_type:complete
MSDELVYSSSNQTKKNKKTKNTKTSYQKGKGPVKFRLEKKSRGGKIVSVLYDLPYCEEDAIKLLKDLQTKLACGGTLKDSMIELRGDNKLKIKDYFEKQNLKILGCS